MTRIAKLRNSLLNENVAENINSEIVKRVVSSASENMATFNSTWDLESSFGNNGLSGGKLDPSTKRRFLEELSEEEKNCLQEVKLG